jgi:hypothetical protein
MFFKKGRGRCGCVYGTKGAVDRKSLGTADLDGSGLNGIRSCVAGFVEDANKTTKRRIPEDLNPLTRGSENLGTRIGRSTFDIMTLTWGTDCRLDERASVPGRNISVLQCHTKLNQLAARWIPGALHPRVKRV